MAATSSGKPATKSWIDDKAHTELARIRKAQRKAGLPLLPRVRDRRAPHADRRQARSSTSARTTTSASRTTRKVKEAAKQGRRQVRVRPLELARAGDDRRARRAREAPREVVRLREVPASFTTGYQAMLGTIASLADKDTTLILDSYSHACILDGTLPRRRRARARARGPLLQPQLGQEPRAHPEDARAQERARARRGRLLARRRQGAPRRVRRDLRRATTRSSSSTTRTAPARSASTARGILEEHGPRGQRADRRRRRSRRRSAASAACCSATSEVVEHDASTTRARFLFSASPPRPRRRRRRDHPRHARGGRPGARARAPPEGASTCAASCTRPASTSARATRTSCRSMCRDERKTLFMHVALLECGVLMVPITYPAVKNGEERLRVNITRGHTQEDMDTALELLKTYGEAFFVLSRRRHRPDASEDATLRPREGLAAVH